jgi:hypothetical protein
MYVDWMNNLCICCDDDQLFVLGNFITTYFKAINGYLIFLVTCAYGTFVL